MLADVLHNLCAQVMDVDQVMAADVDQVMVADVDQVMVAEEIEMVLQEINTKKEEVHVHHMDDKVVTVERSGSLTLKDKD